MVIPTCERDNILKRIFRDGWEEFKENHPRFEGVEAVVEKMLNCGCHENGYACYICADGGHKITIPFSCKSTFCLSCAKSYSLNWVEKVKVMLHPNVKYRHLILTMPTALRPIFYNHPELLSSFMKIAQKTMGEVMAESKNRAVKLGVIVVLQTAGRDATYNPHLHCLITDGGLTDSADWVPNGLFRYNLLHRRWQENLLSMITNELPNDERVQKVVAEMWRRYPNGFVAHLERNVSGNMKSLTRYLVKYVVSPPISLGRIINYDAERGEVTYWYRSHLAKGKKQKVAVNRETFIGRMVQHILPKGFHRIRYYGLQATCVLKKMRQKINLAFKRVIQLGMELLGKPVANLSYQEKIQQSYGRDPFTCSRCGGLMYLWELMAPKSGFYRIDSNSSLQ